MKKLLFKLKRLLKKSCITLISISVLYAVPAYADFFPQLTDHACLADYSETHLTCSANDIQVSEVTNVTNLDGTTPVECVLGQEVTFRADVTVITTANERYGYGIWLPEGNYSAKDQNPANTCSVLIGDAFTEPGVDLDDDICADISKAAGFSPIHVYENEEITMFCRDDDNSGQADFNYCASWNQKSQDAGTCDETTPTPAGSPSKCRCDVFDIDVFIQPDPPAVLKTLTSQSSRPEPGGTFDYTVSFTNPNASTSLFITSLSDEIDIGGEGTFDSSLDLWGSLDTVLPLVDGVYLTATNCAQPADTGEGVGEILAGGTYSCMFSVYIFDSDLPNNQTAEFYDDLVMLTLEDKNGDVVPDGTSCAAIPSSIDGDHCTNEITVQITNLAPDIRVVKTADKDNVVEPGEDVVFTITVHNDSGAYDSPVVVTSLMDSIYGNLTALGDCNTIGSIAFGASDSCSFTEYVSGDWKDSFTNEVTAIARDNEYDTDTATDTHTVLVLNVPSMIDLTKTAVPSSVLETGDDDSIYRDVKYTFDFSVNVNGVDNVIFSSLTDDMFGDITDECNFGTVMVPMLTLLDGLELMPGESDSCFIYRGLQGDDDDSHVNKATINGDDTDGEPVMAMDSETVEFDPVAPASDMDFATRTLVVIRLHNTGIENLTLTALTVMGLPVADNDDQTSYVIRNLLGGEHELSSYLACNIGEVLGYSGSGTETYTCAFSIEHLPGLDSSTNINFSGLLTNGVVATLTDDDDVDSSNAVGIQVFTVEP